MTGVSREGPCCRSFLHGAVIVALLVTGCTFAQSPPYRLLPGLDLLVFSGGPNPEHLMIRSREDLIRTLDAGEKAWSDPELYRQRKASFLRSLGDRVDWSREALVIVQEYYGTGMASAHLNFRTSEPRVLDVTIVWKVPPPPLTPDTTVFRGAFAVKKVSISKVTISGRAGTRQTRGFARTMNDER